MIVNNYKIEAGANLQHADLRGASLLGTSLLGADLQGADLRGANLRGADLRGANLCGADLLGANLLYANLRDADLQHANLRDADLQHADLRGADLRDASLCGADLRDADLCGADLRGADLLDADLPHFQIVPSEGDFIAWKKTTTGVVKILIPAHAKRTSSLVGRKCRASSVVVLEGHFIGLSPTHASSRLIYRVGEEVAADRFDDDIRTACTHGIHFFMTKAEAEQW